MNASELVQRLQQEGFTSDVYSVDGNEPSYEGLVLKRDAGRWVVDHFERGISHQLHSFEREDEACNEMYRLLDNHFRW